MTGKQRIIAVAVGSCIIGLFWFSGSPSRTRKIESASSASNVPKAQKERSHVGRSVPSVLHPTDSLPDPEFELLTYDGRLTTGAAEAAQLSDAEREEVDIIVSEAWRELIAQFRDRIRRSAKESDDLISVFLVPSSAGQRDQAISDIKVKLENAVGSQRAEILLPSFANNAALGGLGKFDVRIEQEKYTRVFRWQYNEAGTGKLVQEGTGMGQETITRFGGDSTFKLLDEEVK